MGKRKQPYSGILISMAIRYARLLFSLLFLVLTLAGAFWLAAIAIESPRVPGLLAAGGYFGVFVFSFINGCIIFVPIVTASFVPALVASGLEVLPLILIITLGMTLADSVAFFLGRLGRAQVLASNGRLASFLATAGAKHSWLPLVVVALWAAFVPLANEVILFPVGLLGYRAHQVIPMLVLGSLTLNTLFSLGFLGIFGRITLL